MFNLLILRDIPILEQLRIEEALMRVDRRNWCVLNTGSTPAIVMGISGKPEKLLDVARVKQDRIPVIKRFSGGGTVYIDANTVFATFICNSHDFAVKTQPKPIMEWSEKIYSPIFDGFALRENDYVFGEQKFGGNAQYIQKGRWLHHSSLLWDYEVEMMEYLRLPEKRPQYRQTRSHKDFLCPLKPYFESKESLMQTIASHLKHTHNMHERALKEIAPICNQPHRKSTCLINL